MTDWKGSWHPLAVRFPMLGEDDLREMAGSIAENGQHVPCRMTPDGLGLDGRNRVAACGLANVEPVFEVYEGDPVAFIVDVNAQRRHLTTGQRAMATAIGLVEAGKRSNGRFRRGTVPDANDGSANTGTAWRARMKEAGVVLDHAPEIADRVLAGDLALDAAHKQAEAVRDRRKRLAKMGGDLASLVESDVITLAEAERRIEDETRLQRLDADLVERVQSGALALDEAEDIAAKREVRLDMWVAKVRDAYEVLQRMAGHPIPDGFRDRLDEETLAWLGTVLALQSSIQEEAVA